MGHTSFPKDSEQRRKAGMLAKKRGEAAVEWFMMGNPRYMGMEAMQTHEDLMQGMGEIWNEYVIPRDAAISDLQDQNKSLLEELELWRGQGQHP